MAEEFVEEEGAPAALEDVDRRGFRCENCGADAEWDPDADALSCDHCGHTQAVPRDEGTVLERSLDEAGTAARGLGLEVRVVRCENCGASVTFETTATSRNCVFCGSSNVLDQEANRNAIRPESVVPMDVGSGTVQRSFERWVTKGWFRPNALKKLKTFDAVGVYVPHWTFDCRVHSDWSADSGTYYYVTVPTTVIVNGKPQVRMRQERRVRWRPAWGDRRDAYDDILVNASRAVPKPLAKKLGGFDTSELVPYRPEYLAGFHAEEYTLDLEGGWEVAQEHVASKQRSRCASDVPGDTYRRLRVRNSITDTTWKHVLLPIWSLTYEFGGKTWPVLIHGQTGRVRGKRPISWRKIVLLVVCVLGALALVGAIAAALGVS